MKSRFFKVLLVSSFVAVIGLVNVKAQQDPLFTQYHQNPMLVNPGYAGSQGLLNATFMSRIQWTGFDGAPRTNLISISSPIVNENFGVGLNILNDRIGPVNQTGVFADFSYNIQLDAVNNLRFGLRAGGNFFSATLGELRTVDDADVAFSTNISGQFLPNFGFGAYYTGSKLFAGVSIPRLLSNKIDFNDGNVSQPAFTEKQHFYLMAGGMFPVNANLKFRPTATLRYVSAAPISLDVNATFILAEKFWVGANYRLDDSFGGLFQIQATEQFRFGYSYDYNTSLLRKYNGGSHEIMLTYDFNFSRTGVKSPRYF